MVKVNNLSASPGDYEVSIKFNNEHIPDSPFIVPIATLSDEARRLTVTSLQVRLHTHTHTNKILHNPCEFDIQIRYKQKCHNKSDLNNRLHVNMQSEQL